MNTMETTIGTSKKRSINISEDIFLRLSHDAKEKGENVNEYIEFVLREVANNNAIEKMNDEEAYQWLSANKPDGHVMMNEEEQEELENWLGLKRKWK